MFALGLLKEVEGLLKKKLSITAQKIIGISEIKSFLNKDLSQDEAKELIKKNTRQFAKRQLTWFRKDKRVEWIDIANLKPSDTTLSARWQVPAQPELIATSQSDAFPLFYALKKMG